MSRGEHDMELDFTYTKYKKLCKAIMESNYPVLTVNKYLSSRKPLDKFIILRHDVDLKPERSLHIAKLESELGISSTYYFRMIREVYKPELIKKIAAFGHEIGYHYEVVDKAKGDLEKALEIFKSELAKLKVLTTISTICMHGRSWSKWDNRTLWEKYDFTRFGILGEAYLSIDYSNIAYFSDTARTWDITKYRMKDTVNSTLQVKIQSTDELINIIKRHEYNRICILMHPDVWGNNIFQWLSDLAIQSAKNIVKRYIKS